MRYTCERMLWFSFFLLARLACVAVLHTRLVFAALFLDFCFLCFFLVASRVFVFGLFNPEYLDVLLKSRPAASEGKWENGWNLYSKKSVLTFLQERGFSGQFYDFELSLDLEKKPDDPLRTWTERLEDGRRIIINGLQLVNTLSLLEISKS